MDERLIYFTENYSNSQDCIDKNKFLPITLKDIIENPNMEFKIVWQNAEDQFEEDPDFNCENIFKLKDKNWDWGALSGFTFITKELVYKTLDKNWDWDALNYLFKIKHISNE